MPAGRPNKPLFELLRDESTGRRTPPIRPSILARPAPEPELKPVPARPSLDPDQEPVPESYAESGGPSSEPAPYRGSFLRFSGESVHVSRYAVWAAFTVVLAVVFAVYVVAYRAGRQEANKEAARQVPPDSPPITGVQPGVVRPSETLIPRAPVADTTPKTPAPSKGASLPKSKGGSEGSKSLRPTPPAFDDPTKPVLTATGAFDADPRTPGSNYLVLATRLTREDARKLVAFLTANGLETVGIPAKTVESEGRQANNPGSYKVVTLAGLTRDQYRSDDPLKAKLKSEGTRLGELWKEQNKSTIIKDTYWESLTP